MTTPIHATDARRLATSARPLLPSPLEFDGTLDELTERFILPNLPSAASVGRFHELLASCIDRADAIFLLRAVRGTERRQIYTTRDSTRFKATDNAPAWWIHAALYQDYTIDPSAFPEVMASLPTHFHDVQRTCGPTANAAGWHVAHLFNVKDGRTDFTQWERTEVVARFVRNIHPCNYFLLPKTDWQRWGGDERVLAYFGRLFAERYASVWPTFVRLAAVDAFALGTVTGAIAYSFEQESSSGPSEHRMAPAGDTLPGLHPAHVAEYRASRLTFKRDVIEALVEGEVFRIITPVGTFAMTRADVYRVFPKMVQTRSYREQGIYHTPSLLAAIEPFRITEPDVARFRSLPE